MNEFEQFKMLLERTERPRQSMMVLGREIRAKGYLLKKPAYEAFFRERGADAVYINDIAIVYEPAVLDGLILYHEERRQRASSLLRTDLFPEKPLITTIIEDKFLHEYVHLAIRQRLGQRKPGDRAREVREEHCAYLVQLATGGVPFYEFANIIIGFLDGEREIFAPIMQGLDARLNGMLRTHTMPAREALQAAARACLEEDGLLKMIPSASER